MAIGDGLVTMTPASITFTGTSAVVNSVGGVDFVALTNLSLNGIFTSDYENYLIVIRAKANAGQEEFGARLRVAGVDASGASDYARQRFYVGGADFTLATERTTDSSFEFCIIDNQGMSGAHVHLYGPYLAQETAMRSIGVNGEAGGYITDYAGVHSLTTSYDGLTLTPTGNNFTGNLHVFGYEE